MGKRTGYPSTAKFPNNPENWWVEEDGKLMHQHNHLWVVCRATYEVTDDSNPRMRKGMWVMKHCECGAYPPKNILAYYRLVKARLK